MLKILIKLWILLILTHAGIARADLVLIVNSKNTVDQLNREQVTNIYMGRLRQFPSGQIAQPFDLPVTETERALFYRLLINKTLSDIDAYWARLVFSGRASPPISVKTPKEAVDTVANDKHSIAYVDRALVDSRVKIVMELQENGKH